MRQSNIQRKCSLALFTKEVFTGTVYKMFTGTVYKGSVHWHCLQRTVYKGSVHWHCFKLPRPIVESKRIQRFLELSTRLVFLQVLWINGSTLCGITQNRVTNRKKNYEKTNKLLLKFVNNDLGPPEQLCQGYIALFALI